MIRIGLVGAGVFGYHHARVLAGQDQAAFAGLHDLMVARAEEVAKQFNTKSFATLEDLFEACDAVIIAVPTQFHLEVALQAARWGKHALVEKPIAASVEAAREMVDAFGKAGLVLAVGQIERHNPAVEAVLKLLRHPRYLTIERLAVFTPRSLDVDVILDLMIHDIQIVQDLAKSELVDAKAIGVPVLSPKVDIANARLQFANGLVANLTASRISQERVRKLRIFEPRAYFSVDYAVKTIKAYQLVPEGGKNRIEDIKVDVAQQEPLRAELLDFIRAIEEKRPALVDGSKGMKALEIACRIQEELK
jgi:predicted dehydrogenase